VIAAAPTAAEAHQIVAGIKRDIDELTKQNPPPVSA
jgi:hypothetical protein